MLRHGEVEVPLTRYGTTFLNFSITNFGRVFQLKKQGWVERVPAFYAYVRHAHGNGASGGNSQLTIRDDTGARHRIRIHRAVMEAFKPLAEFSHEIGIPTDVWLTLPVCVTSALQHCVLVNHKDGNPKNNSIQNLEWSTPMDNHRKARLSMTSSHALAPTPTPLEVGR